MIMKGEVMPRSHRVKSASGFYHVYNRGVGKQILFETKVDYLYFLKLMKEKGGEYNIEFIAYCLMENHFHFLLNNVDGHLAPFMRDLCSRYAIYFNKKYDRSGHLFQDRYQCICVENESYLLALFRYILQNPEKAGIAKTDKYRWSSYKEHKWKKPLVNTRLIEFLIGGSDHFEEFVRIPVQDSVKDFSDPDEISENIDRIFLHVTGSKDGTELQKMPLEKRNECIRNLWKYHLSYRTIERKTGISRRIITRICKEG